MLYIDLYIVFGRDICMGKVKIPIVVSLQCPISSYYVTISRFSNIGTRDLDLYISHFYLLHLDTVLHVDNLHFYD